MSHMPQTEDFSTVASLFKLLADTTRLRIFWILCHKEDCILHLAELLEISSPAISHHIQLLKSSNLLTARKDGREVYYKAADTEVCHLLHRAIEKTMQLTCPITCTLDHTEPKDGYMRKVHDYLLANLEKRITTQSLSLLFSMNPTTLKSKFKQAYGHSIAAHMQLHRMEKAANLLKESDLSVQDIANLVGYASHSKFSAVFRQSYGISPLEYRKRKPTV